MFLIYLLNNFFQAFSCEAYACGVRWWRCMEYVGGDVWNMLVEKCVVVMKISFHEKCAFKKCLFYIYFRNACLFVMCFVEL